MAENSSNMVDMLGASPVTTRRRIGRRARDLRLADRRSQADVASAAGVSVPTLARFEAGSNVSLDVLVRVAIALSADQQLGDLFALPDAQTIDDILKRRAIPQRGRSRR